MKPGWLAGPIVLVTIGVVFLLHNMGMSLPIASMFRAVGRFIAGNWPLLLIAIGVIQLFSIPLQIARGKRGFLVGPVTLLTLGFLFLLQQWDLVGFRFSWPVLLIAIGVAIFAQNVLGPAASGTRPFRGTGSFKQ